MSIQLQSMSTVLSVSPERSELTAIKNEPLESEIGIDIPNSLDEEIIPDIKDIDIVLHELSEDLIKSETVSENTFENNHSGSVEIQVFVKTENTSLIENENITQSEYLYKTQDISDGNVSRGTSQGVLEVQGKEGSNEHFTASRSDKQFVNFFKDSSDISRKAKCPNKTVFPECYKIVETTSCKKDRRKEKVIEVPVIPIEPHKYTSSAKTKHAGHTNKSTPKQNKKSYCCEKCTFISKNHSYFKRHKLSHKSKAEEDSRNLKYRCDKCKYKTCYIGTFNRHKLIHLKPEEIPYFYCYHCPYKCKQKSHLKIHIFSHFKKKEVPFHCYICDFTTVERNLIIEHFKKHPKHHTKCDETDFKNQFETYAKYHCDKCKYKTCSSGHFKIHKLMHLKPEEIPYFYCYHCSFKSKRKGSLKIHIFNHFKKEEVPFHCYICDFTTLKRDLIIEHFKKHPKHHNRKCDETDYKYQVETYTKYCCDKCKYKTYFSSHFKAHKLKHLKPKQIPYFYCYHCPYKCKLKGNLKIHIFNHFKKQEVSFYCYICDFTTLERNLIIEHCKKHPKHHSKCDETDYKNQVETYTKYRCDKCKYKTYMCSSLKIHKLKHLKPEEIPYFYCYHCPYKCKQKGSLKIHIFNHFKREEVPFHCYICDFATLKRNLIIEHFKKHPKKRMRHRCKKCSFGTYRYVSLKLHELTHKTEAKMDVLRFKYCCDKCNYKTYVSTSLKKHKLIHLKPEEIQYFYCYHCSYKSKWKYSLKPHILKHFKKEEIPFHCHICDFVTLKRESFKKHIKHHNRCDEKEYRNQLLRFYKIL